MSQDDHIPLKHEQKGTVTKSHCKWHCILMDAKVISNRRVKYYHAVSQLFMYKT